MEDQRGTEINFELPDFLKDNNNKLRKFRAADDSMGNEFTCDSMQKKPLGKTPQPAPRLSISRSNDSSEHSASSPEKNITRVMLKDHTAHQFETQNEISIQQKCHTIGIVPPPLPPKPKVKPPWTQSDDKFNGNGFDTMNHSTLDVRKIKSPIANRINMLNSAVAASEKKFAQPRTIYFDQLNSSFV